MSDIAPTPTDTDIRDALLAGTATFKELAEALGCTERTIYRLGLPFFTVAGKRRAVLSLARERLMARAQGSERPPPRKPGRPRKQITSTT